MVTGRDIFLVPEPAESARSIRTRFDLPAGWTTESVWKSEEGHWVPQTGQGSPAEQLAASVWGLGSFHTHTLAMGRTKIRLSIPDAVPADAARRAVETVRRVTAYVHGVFKRDLGATYTVVAVPDTPEGLDLAGSGCASGQGRTLLPISTERTREFALELIQAYVRHPPYRSAIRIPQEFWLVDAISQLYSRRAVTTAGFGDSISICRSLGAAYLNATAVEDVNRDLETLYESGKGDAGVRESIAPFVLLNIDQELRTRYGMSQGIDELIPTFCSGSVAPSFWSLVPQKNAKAWTTFRRNYVRGTALIPVPDIFPVGQLARSPNLLRGNPESGLTIMYTGNTDGYLENCGCKANESGGIARRATVIDSVRGVDRDALLLDAGSAFDRPKPFESPNALARMEQGFYLQMMDEMGYDAAVIGVGELAHGGLYFRELTQHVRTPFLGANIHSQDASFGRQRVKVMTIRGRRILVVGVFEPPGGGKSWPFLDRELARVEIENPVRAVGREISLHGRNVDLIFVIGRISPGTVRELVKEFPEIDVILSSESTAPRWDETQLPRRVIVPDDQQGFLGRTLILYALVGQYGMGIANLGLDDEGHVRDATLAESWLTDRVPDQERVRKEMNRFYDRVGTLPEAQASVHAPLAKEPYWQGRAYVGAKVCQGCHEQEFAQWKETPHASAFKTLLDRHRHYQPVCLSCHVVGFGSRYGYRVGQSEQPLGNVQCEICHGPGKDHADLPSRLNIRRKVPEAVCLECHNADHSSNFVYVQRLPRVLHQAAVVTTAR
jgi:cytochrome c554/c'-like protein